MGRMRLEASGGEGMNINQDRLNEVMSLSLLSGGHKPGKEMCAMEAAAYIAGEEWSNHPKCVCPVISSFMRSWNDGLPSNEDRDRLLKPLLPNVIGTLDTELEERRSYMALDWLIRVHTPRFLDLNESLKSHAKALRDLNEITDLAGATAAGELTRAARAAAGVTAGTATWDATWTATWNAARAAAWDAAARAATWVTARAVTWVTAWNAARGAAWNAARAAAGDALKPTVEWLQASAGNLVIEMCKVEA